jgi:hypothetical protein
MDGMNSIRGNDSDHGMSFSGVSNRLQKAIRAKKKFLAMGLLVLLAGWIPLMTSMGVSNLDSQRLPAHLGQPLSLLSSTRKSFWFKGEMTAWLAQGFPVERSS